MFRPEENPNHEFIYIEFFSYLLFAMLYAYF